MKRYTTIFFLLLLLPGSGKCQSIMNGEWDFALDPVKAGEKQQWYASEFSTAGFDKVRLPHCYSVDRRYAMYTGTAWYFKKFTVSPVQPGFRAFLRFEAVFYKTTVWLNGKMAGSHEGGYTPFEMDVTDLLQAKNQLSVSVNNEWDTTTIPGAKTENQFSRADHSQLYAWINYGGITRPVELVIRPDVRIRNVQVIAEPYRFLQDEFAPLVIEGVLWKEGKLRVVLQSRKDFPAYTLRNYQLRYGNTTIPLKVMKPGDRQQLEIPTENKELSISIINPQGFTVLQKIYNP